MNDYVRKQLECLADPKQSKYWRTAAFDIAEQAPEMLAEIEQLRAENKRLWDAVRELPSRYSSELDAYVVLAEDVLKALETDNE